MGVICARINLKFHGFCKFFIISLKFHSIAMRRATPQSFSWYEKANNIKWTWKVAKIKLFFQILVNKFNVFYLSFASLHLGLRRKKVSIAMVDPVWRHRHMRKITFRLRRLYVVYLKLLEFKRILVKIFEHVLSL